MLRRGPPDFLKAVGLKSLFRGHLPTAAGAQFTFTTALVLSAGTFSNTTSLQPLLQVQTQRYSFIFNTTAPANPKPEQAPATLQPEKPGVFSVPAPTRVGSTSENANSAGEHKMRIIVG